MAGRSRLSMFELIQDGILTPGDNLLTFDYMGRRCEADLLPDGLILWEGTKFSSPYAWASQCKNLVNPDHKSGIGWGHIRYKGIKLSQYKSVYLKRHRLTSSDVQDSLSSSTEDHSPFPEKKEKKRRGRKKQESRTTEPLEQSESPAVSTSELLGNQNAQGGGLSDVDQRRDQSPASVMPTPDTTACKMEPQQAVDPVTATTTAPTSNSSFVPCTPFEVLGLHQQFAVKVSSNPLMIMDFHAHLCTNEVTGYLGGKYDVNSKSLEVLQAFPCLCDASSNTEIAQKEKEIQSRMIASGLDLVGWYHSHPFSEPDPTHNDIISQKSYQDVMRMSDGDEPCVGVIISPNHGGKLTGMMSYFNMFWVLMLEQNGLKASAMNLSFSKYWEQYLTQDVVDEMNAIVGYYKTRPDTPNIKALWKDETYFITKLKSSLSNVQPRFPGENSDVTFTTYIDQLLIPI